MRRSPGHRLSYRSAATGPAASPGRASSGVGTRSRRRRVAHGRCRRWVDFDHDGETITQAGVGRIDHPLVAVEHPARPVHRVAGSIHGRTGVDEPHGDTGLVGGRLGAHGVAVDVDERHRGWLTVELRLIAERHLDVGRVPEAHRTDRRDVQASRLRRRRRLCRRRRRRSSSAACRRRSAACVVARRLPSSPSGSYVQSPLPENGPEYPLVHSSG